MLHISHNGVVEECAWCFGEQALFTAGTAIVYAFISIFVYLYILLVELLRNS